MKKWITAFRLRTLPLSLACVGMGSFLAAAYEVFKWDILMLTLLTTLFLQILSNLSNDYGDYLNGADSESRKGPSRSVQSGAISPRAMLNAIVIFALLSFISGIYLLYESVPMNLTFLVFLILGILSIGAAIYYTMGKSPYGYAGLGDLSVFLFFGWIGVGGSFYLHGGFIDAMVFLPATSCSFLAVAVLNINNIRDIESDAEAGKRSIPVRIGRKNAILYHYSLLFGAIIFALIFVLLKFQSYWQLMFLLVIPLLLKNASAVSTLKKAHLLDPYLKQMALTTLLFVILFGVGLLIP
jgi:1,4-dihydroxy-2-naphthoate octaprenyltransferase